MDQLGDSAPKTSGSPNWYDPELMNTNLGTGTPASIWADVRGRTTLEPNNAAAIAAVSAAAAAAAV